MRPSLLLCSLCFGLNVASANTRTVEAVRVAGAIALDGHFGEPEWRKAQWETGFVKSTDPTAKADVATKVAALCGNDALYVGVVAHEPNVSRIVAKYRDHDARVYADDSIELFVNPHAYQNDTYFWFAVNSLGTRAEGKGIQAGTMLDRTWDCGWKVATAVGADRWSVEVMIPYYAIELDDQVSSAWRFNVTRNRKAAGGYPYWTLNPVSRGFHDSASFGRLTGLDGSALRPFAVRVGTPVFSTVPKLKHMQVTVRMPVRNLAGVERTLLIEGYLISPDGTPHIDKFSCELAHRQEREIVLDRYTVSKPGTYTFVTNVRDPGSGKSRHVSKVSHEISFMPLVLRIRKPAYRNAIYATAPVDEIEAEVTIREDADLLPQRRLALRLIGDDGAAVATTRVDQIAASPAPIRLPAKGLRVGTYTLRATLTDLEGRRLASVEQTLTKCPRAKGDEVICDPDTGRVVLVNGKPFMPIGLYQIHAQEMRAYRSRGYSAIGHFWAAGRGDDRMTQVTKLLLDTAAKYDLRMQVYPYPDWKWMRKLPGVQQLSDTQWDDIRTAVALHKDHAGLFNWYLADEPECHDKSPALMQKMYQFVAGADPYHIVSIVNNSPMGHHTYQDCADVYSPDVYMYHRKDKFDYDLTRERVVASLDEAYKATEGRKPIWVVIQIFDPSTFGNWPTLRGPTFDELRASTYLAIVHHANGFFFYNNPNPYSEYPEVRIALEQAIIPELRHFESVILLGAEGPVTVRSATGKVHAMLREYDGQTYIFAVNGSGPATTATFAIPHAIEGKLNVTGEQRVVSVTDSAFTDDFAGYDARVYTTARAEAPLKTMAQARAQIAKALAALKKPGNLAYADPKITSPVKTAASSSTRQFHSHLVTDGVTTGRNYWQDGTRNEFPDWVEVKLPQVEPVSRVTVHTPNLRDYDMQVHIGDSWKVVDRIRGNTSIELTHRFAPVSTDCVRLVVRAAHPDPPYQAEGVTYEFVSAGGDRLSRVNEIEVYRE